MLESITYLAMRKSRRAAPYPRLLVAVIAIWSLFIAYCLYRLVEEPFVVVAGAMLIATAALFPAYLWTEGRVPGLPILPLHTVALLWTFAFPLVAGHPEIGIYDPDEIVFAAVCIALYAIFAAAAWYFIATRPFGKRARYFVLPEGRGYPFFLGATVLGGIFIAMALGHAINLAPGLYGIVRSSILAFASIALFVLSARWGRGELRQAQLWAFVTAAAFFIAMQLATLFLVGAIVSLACALIGFTIGRGRVPWVAIASALLLFGFLHSGKSEMRERYWGEDAPPLALYELPPFFAEWVGAGARALSSPETPFGQQPIQERLSLMHLLLLAQRNTPDQVPYLAGATYSIIPRLLLPRIIDPDKPHSHQGTATLNVHYGIQSMDDTEGTTVGWGLLNEAYANFGLGGVLAIACFLGALFGLIGRMSAGAPLMSLENMVGVTFSVLAIQAEFTMAVFATVAFQSLVVLLLVLPFLRKRQAGEAH